MTLDTFNSITVAVVPQSLLWKYSCVRQPIRRFIFSSYLRYIHVRYDVDENILQNPVVLAEKKQHLAFSSDFEINSGYYIHEERIKNDTKTLS